MPMSPAIRKAVIPAAGLGTRFLPATKAVPKEMLPVVDTPTIQYVVEEAVAAGLDNVLLITGHGKGAIEDHFDRAHELEEALEAKGDTAGLELIRESDHLAAVHSIRQGAPKGIDQVSLYGAAAFEPTGEDDVVTVTDLVEKPSPDDAPSNQVIIGRYVCDPAIFGVLRRTPPGRGGEIQITDALKTLAQMTPADGGGVRGVLFHGRRFDTGNRVDYLRTVVQFACERPDVADEFVPWLRKYVDSLG